MNVGSSSFASRRDTVAFISCLVLAVVARALPPGVSDQVASSLRRSVLAPFLSLEHKTELLRARRAEFDEIVVQLDSAIMLVSELPTLRAENERLRTILRLRPRMNVRHVAAEVLHQTQPGDFVTLIVSAGATQGVRQWAPVVAASGLLGTVHTVDSETALVHAWTHPEFRAGATTLDGTVVGIVAPRTGGGSTSFLELREVPHLLPVTEGSVIVTSGRGGVYPRGIPIGRIGPMLSEQQGFTKTYLVDPLVRPAVVSHVLILLADVDDVSHVFTNDSR